MGITNSNLDNGILDYTSLRKNIDLSSDAPGILDFNSCWIFKKWGGHLILSPKYHPPPPGTPLGITPVSAQANIKTLFTICYVSVPSNIWKEIIHQQLIQLGIKRGDFYFSHIFVKKLIVNYLNTKKMPIINMAIFIYCLKISILMKVLPNKSKHIK